MTATIGKTIATGARSVPNDWSIGETKYALQCFVTGKDWELVDLVLQVCAGGAAPSSEPPQPRIDVFLSVPLYRYIHVCV